MENLKFRANLIRTHKEDGYCDDSETIATFLTERDAVLFADNYSVEAKEYSSEHDYEVDVYDIEDNILYQQGVNKEEVNENTKTKIMKNSNNTTKEILKVTGDYCSKTTYMSWDCPFESQKEEMWVQGELYFNKKTNKFEHEVTNDNGEIIYIVESQEFN